MKGLSLFAEGERGHSYFEALSASLNRGWAPLAGVLDGGGKKLIELPVPELYDLPRDPKEEHEPLPRGPPHRRRPAQSKLKADAPAPVQGARRSAGSRRPRS